MGVWTAIRRRTMWRSVARRLRVRADEQRAEGRFREAAALYVATHDVSGDARMLVQAGHMHKEAGDFALAECDYRTALQTLPDDADLALQIGHLGKVTGRPGDALSWYRRAASLAPGWGVPVAEIDRLAPLSRGHGVPAETILVYADGEVANDAPTSFADPIDQIMVRHLGSRRSPEDPGIGAVLKGVESVRAVCVSMATLTGADLVLSDAVVACAPAIVARRDVNGLAKYVIHFWVDVSHVAAGPASLAIVVHDEHGGVRSSRHDVHIGEAPSEAAQPDVDAVVDPPADPGIDLTDFLRSRPSEIRSARVSPMMAPRTILILRADQMGDMVVSVPALLRLRALVPSARIVGVVTAANAALAETLGVFDALEVIEWASPDEGGGRRLSRGELARITDAMGAYHADVAIDLMVNEDTRPLLARSGATHTVGFGHAGRWPWLTLALAVDAPDGRTGLETAPHETKLLTLVEAFGAIMVGERFDTDRTQCSPDTSGGPFASLRSDDRPYAVLHTGGRLAFSRWHGYADLAERLLHETNLAVVVFGGDPVVLERLRSHPRVTIVIDEPPFDAFDALLGRAAVFVGNDSGPKHLAALRGTPVVSVHSSRIDWREWGQTRTGYIVSRRLPCAGCSLHGAQVDECGRDYACVADIAVDEVLDAIKAALR